MYRGFEIVVIWFVTTCIHVCEDDLAGCNDTQISAFRRNVFFFFCPSSTLTIEAVSFSETFVSTHKFTRRCHPEDQHLHLYGRENLILYVVTNSLKERISPPSSWYGRPKSWYETTLRHNITIHVFITARSADLELFFNRYRLTLWGYR